MIRDQGELKVDTGKVALCQSSYTQVGTNKGHETSFARVKKVAAIGISET